MSGVLRLLRFSVAGATGFAVQIAALGLLLNLLRVNYLLATVIAVEVAIVVNYFWHERYTWRDRFAGGPGAVGRFCPLQSVDGGHIDRGEHGDYGRIGRIIRDLSDAGKRD